MATETVPTLAEIREARERLHGIARETPVFVSETFSRMVGRDVQLITSGAALARQVEHVLGSRSLANPRAEAAGPGPPDEGDYRFLCTGDIEAFRGLGTRFLQMPLGTVEHVDLRAEAMT